MCWNGTQLRGGDEFKVNLCGWWPFSFDAQVQYWLRCLRYSSRTTVSRRCILFNGQRSVSSLGRPMQMYSITSNSDHRLEITIHSTFKIYDGRWYGKRKPFIVQHSSDVYFRFFWPLVTTARPVRQSDYGRQIACLTIINIAVVSERQFWLASLGSHVSESRPAQANNPSWTCIALAHVFMTLF